MRRSDKSDLRRPRSRPLPRLRGLATSAVSPSKMPKKALMSAAEPAIAVDQLVKH
jgi:hypothetical protein